MGAAEGRQLPPDMLAAVNTIKDPALRKQMENFGQAIAAREKQEREKRGPEARKAVAKVVPFPAETRPASNDLIRSALFAAVRGKHRQHFKDFVQLAAFGDIEIWWQGYQLNQDDHDAFMQLVFMAQHQPLGEDVRVSFKANWRVRTRSRCIGPEKRRPRVVVAGGWCCVTRLRRPAKAGV